METWRRDERRSSSGVPAPTDHTLALRQARAQITWGKDPERVRQGLLDAGVPMPLALKTVRGAMAQRNAEFRRKGLLHAVAGVLLLAGSLIALALFLRHSADDAAGPASRRGAPAILLVLVLGVGAGISLLGGGVWKLLRGGAGEGSQTRLE